MKKTQINRKKFHSHGIECSMRIFSWKNYHCYYVNITGNNTDLMQSLSKLQMALSIEINNLKLVWNHKTLQIEKAIEKKRCWRHHAPWFQAISQSHSNQKSIVLLWNQIRRSMQQNRNFRNKLMHTCSLIHNRRVKI